MIHSQDLEVMMMKAIRCPDCKEIWPVALCVDGKCRTCRRIGIRGTVESGHFTPDAIGRCSKCGGRFSVDLLNDLLCDPYRRLCDMCYEAHVGVCPRCALSQPAEGT